MYNFQLSSYFQQVFLFVDYLPTFLLLEYRTLKTRCTFTDSRVELG